MQSNATKYNKIKSILSQGIEWINMLSAIYLVVTLILPFEYQKPAMYSYFTTLGLDIIINQRYKDVKWNNVKWTFVAMILFYLCIWIWHPFENTNLPYFFATAEKRIGLIIFGLLGIFTNINPKIKPTLFAIPMMATGTIIYLFILYKINFIHNTYDSFSAYQEAVALYRSITMKISHMNFNLYLNCGMIFSIFAIIKSNKLWKKLIYTTFIIPSLFIVITSDGRIGLLTALSLISILCLHLTYRKNKYLPIPLAIILIIAISFIFNNHYRVQEGPISQNPRITIWNESIEMIKEKPFFGYGLSDGRTTLVSRLFQNQQLISHFLNPWFSDFPDFNKYSLHAHNIFLESMIEFGLIGLILISLILTLPLIFTNKRRRIILTLFISIFTIQGLTESPGNHLSIFLLSWFLYIIMLYQIEDPKEKTLEN